MDCDIKEIGKRITALRKKNGNISQEELAKNLNVSRDVVAKWELGKRDLKTEYTVKLADFFDVSCDYILRNIEHENLDIHNATGLSQTAIENLKKLRNPENPKIKAVNQIDTLNLILEIAPHFLMEVGAYVNLDFDGEFRIEKINGKANPIDYRIVYGEFMHKIHGYGILQTLDDLRFLREKNDEKE